MTDTGAILIALAADGGGREQDVQLIPAGTSPGRDGRGPYHLTDPAAVIEETRRYAGKTLLAIDYDHQTDRPGQRGADGRAPAAGWITGLRAATDGIYGRVEWTETATQLIAEKAYRYLSPVLLLTRAGVVKALVRAALVNNPNLDLKALCSAGGSMTEDFAGRLRRLVGLDGGADDAAVLARIEELTTEQATAASSPNPAEYVPLGEFERMAIELNATRRRDAERKVDDATIAGQLPPFMRDWGLALCASNPAAFDAFVAKMPPIVTPGGDPRFRGKPTARTGQDLTEHQLAVCSAMAVSPEDYAKSLEG